MFPSHWMWVPQMCGLQRGQPPQPPMGPTQVIRGSWTEAPTGFQALLLLTFLLFSWGRQKCGLCVAWSNFEEKAVIWILQKTSPPEQVNHDLKSHLVVSLWHWSRLLPAWPVLSCVTSCGYWSTAVLPAVPRGSAWTPTVAVSMTPSSSAPWFVTPFLDFWEDALKCWLWVPPSDWWKSQKVLERDSGPE